MTTVSSLASACRAHILYGKKEALKITPAANKTLNYYAIRTLKSACVGKQPNKTDGETDPEKFLTNGETTGGGKRVKNPLRTAKRPGGENA